MTIQEALNILVRTASEAHVPFAIHTQAQQAAQMLQQFIIEKSDKKEE